MRFHLQCAIIASLMLEPVSAAAPRLHSADIGLAPARYLIQCPVVPNNDLILELPRQGQHKGP